MSERGPVPPPASGETRPGIVRYAGPATTRGVEHLDFGVRNTLLYYKDLKQSTLDLSPGSGADPAAVGRLLDSERVSLSEIFPADHEALRRAVKRVRSINYRARRDVDHGSFGTLCVAWGMATWDNGRPATPAAPVVLRQAAVGQHAATGEDFDLTASGPWNLNATLLRLLEVDFEVDVEQDALSDLADELARHGDPQALFERLAKMAADVPGFQVARRVVFAAVPRVAMVVRHEVPLAVEPRLGTAAETDTAGAAAATTQSADLGEAPADDTIERLVRAELNPSAPAEGSLERRRIEQFGPDAVIATITAGLRGDSWPESLIEHADSGLRVRDRAELLRRWYDAGSERPRPTGWDATHFALWGLATAPTAGTPAIRSVARWGERRHHPILVAWELVAERRSKGRRRGRHGRMRFRSQRVSIPKGMDEALWGLPVDLLVEWAAWVFRQWPGAPMELVLPPGTGELVSAWYERARPVAELAVKTWVPFSQVDDALGRSAHRWVKQLTGACSGGGAPLGSWFESSMAVATEAVALRLGDNPVAGTLRGRRGRGRAVAHAEHAI